VTVTKRASSFLEFIVLDSPNGRFDSLFLSNYAVINVQNELARLKGVGAVTIFGAGQYAMRIWMNPDLLQARGLTPQDVIAAIQLQSQQVTAGQVGAPPAPKGQVFQYTLDLKGSMIPRNSRTSSSRPLPQAAAKSPEFAISAASSSEHKPTASRSISTAGRRPESASLCCLTLTPLRSLTLSRRRWMSSPTASRRALTI
jgi:multidrug efflux pump subunit AcrB